MDSTSLDDATLCIPRAGFDFIGDAFPPIWMHFEGFVVSLMG